MEAMHNYTQLIKNDHSQKNVVGLMKNYYNNIIFDAHSPEISINRSLAFKELERRGKEIFPAIGRYLKFTFKEKKDPANWQQDWKYWDLLLAWITLLERTVKTHGLPNPPYDSSVSIVKQDIQKWIKYCENMA